MTGFCPDSFKDLRKHPKWSLRRFQRSPWDQGGCQCQQLALLGEWRRGSCTSEWWGWMLLVFMCVLKAEIINSNKMNRTSFHLLYIGFVVFRIQTISEYLKCQSTCISYHKYFVSKLLISIAKCQLFHAL